MNTAEARSKEEKHRSAIVPENCINLKSFQISTHPLTFRWGEIPKISFSVLWSDVYFNSMTIMFKTVKEND